MVLLLLLAFSVHSSKQTISLEDMVKRADLIIVGRVMDSNKVIPFRTLGEDSDWLSEVGITKVKKESVLEGNKTTGYPKELFVISGSLTFEISKEYIIFLNPTKDFGRRVEDIYKYLDAPAKRVEATKENKTTVKELLKEQGQ